MRVWEDLGRACGLLSPGGVPTSLANPLAYLCPTPASPPPRLWDLRDLLTSTSATSAATISGTSGGSTAADGGGGARCRPATTFTGHRNQRNFVGLSVSPDGHIVCGSEDNSVYSYYRSLPFPTARYAFPAGGGGPGGAAPAAQHQPFVSAVCWANKSRHCLAANSQGLLQVLALE